GWVGMTGNTGGPHVCYRFWKNGEQVDPFKEKLPTAESIPDKLKDSYQTFIQPLKAHLDSIPFKEVKKAEFSSDDNLISLK
ncbi:MAG TPA: M23 family peptidase, partial [Aquaticitalea sp.]|nr:M23 family peptidase [Aquaticitalea sp.]